MAFLKIATQVYANNVDLDNKTMPMSYFSHLLLNDAYPGDKLADRLGLTVDLHKYEK